MMLLTIYMLCLMGQIFISKLEYLFVPPTGICALALIVVFTLLCLLPFHVFYLRSRLELLKVLLQIVISPFGVVKFKHFFLADIITSMVYPLRDLGAIVAFFATGVWLDLSSNAEDLKNSYFT